MPETLYASFADPSLAERAVGALLDAGARNEDISFLAHEAYGETRGAGAATAGVTPPSASAPNWSGTAAGTSTSAAAPVADAGTSATAGTVTGFGAGAGTAAAPSTVSPASGGATITNAGPAYPTSTASAGYSAPASAVDASTSAAATAAGAPGVASYEDEDVDEGDTDIEDRSDHDPVETAKHGISTTTPGDAGAGAIKGAEVGLAVGVLATIASLIIPGFGFVAGGGALATAIGGLVGTTAAGAIAGGAYGFLKDQGVPDLAAAEYHHAVERGGAVIAIQIPSGNVDRATAEQLIAKYGGSNVNSYGGATV